MAAFVNAVQEKLGDPAMAEMNTSRLSGSYDYDTLVNAASAMPFLASRRLVVAENLSKRFQAEDTQAKLLKLLEGLPESAAVIALEERSLKKSDWLLKWAQKAGERAFIKEYAVPQGRELADWIRAYAKSQGGEIDTQAALLLTEIGLEGTRAAALEVDKLLAYVNYSRKIEAEDVDLLTAFASGGGDFFKFIDAIAARNPRGAMDMLQKLLDEQPPLQLFFSLVGHFRVLVQAREVVEGGGNEGSVADRLSMHPYRAKKLTTQARGLRMLVLERIYQRLLQYDVEIKTGQISPELALETLVTQLTV
jgi:DNA polymerase-3 subunit delta